MSEGPSPHARLLRAGLRLQVSASLCLTVLMLLIISGVASITLVFADPAYTRGVQGFEGATLRAVSALEFWITLVHVWGGYVAIVLSGWAGLEVFRYGRALRRAENPKWQRKGLWMPIVGLFAGLVLIGAVTVQVGAGIATRAYVRMPDAPPLPPAMEQRHSLTDARAEMESLGSEQVVDMHTRELNYLVALGALLLVVTSTSARRISQEIRKTAKPERKPEPEPDAE